jgi:hypothetical protein
MTGERPVTQFPILDDEGEGFELRSIGLDRSTPVSQARPNERVPAPQRTLEVCYFLLHILTRSHAR